jgi:cell division protein FtsI (penicillin-binding protein 3)
LIALLTGVFAFASHQVLRPNPDAVNPGAAETDPRIQAIADERLRAHLERRNAESGFVIVSEPDTGRVLAVANQVRKGAPRPGQWSLGERFEPASVMKALVVAAAVDQEAVEWRESFDCGRGNYRVGAEVHHDHHSFDHLTAADTVVHSSNICGIRVAEKLGAEKLDAAVRAFGLGPDGTARDYPGARPGTLPRRDDPQFIPQLSTGYSGLQVTPLEMIQAFGAIANGGSLIKPGTGQPLRRVLQAETASQMRGVLADVVERGTGGGAKSELYSTAGKTGTGFRAEETDHPGFRGDGNVAHFLGFAPVQKPRVVVYAMVVDRYRKLHGGSDAGPLFREVAEQVLQAKGVKPDKN